ncbi:hypothetical protein C343_04172 [Cryptococcus neoformans C23]|nr:hypothetical protein C347_04232 [Cryptococcus neoformans var. grubii AD2-60a]OWZ42246.1 hypothetical protein C343_04172 [Cryptococcus neoformans var. grubii C23]OXC83862.1 hypothetical protein C344_03927 [Cryptococcus neoformans var. grubii AD1-7a]OXG30533.1 hypothetical protein C360_04907 [Cryptococcus neoformans var. grubii Bt15]OXG39875.1 hypothetical protein C359_03794 [Cryptococcus neoformans var. grubii Bt120]OXG48747.1 hypothetical protein C355_03885 [Cryptococcus neoformans var. gru
MMTTHNHPVVEAELVLEAQNNLGEGVVWDSRTQLLHWVDIFRSELHTLDPATGNRSIDVYPQSPCLSYITPRANAPGFIATNASSLVVLPPATKPTTTSPTPVKREYDAVLDETLDAKLVKDGVIRFNDGGVDPDGRVWFGSMGIDENKPEMPGKLFVWDKGKAVETMNNVGVSNGLGWSPDGRTVCPYSIVLTIYCYNLTYELLDYIDSRYDLVSAYTYSTTPPYWSNKRTFVLPPPALDAENPTQGAYDGLCVDGVGNVWVARWRDERVVGFNPEGKLIAMVRLKGCKSPTIPCFGGKDLTTMYIVSATSYRGGDGDHQKWPRSGDLFKVECGPGTEMGKILGAGWKGAERHRAQL